MPSWPSFESTLSCLYCLVAFVVVVAPLYLMLRFLVMLIRNYYGFDAADAEVDAGPPLRICGGCHNTVLENDFSHCPYCGRPLAPIEPAEAGGEPVPPAWPDESPRL